MRPIRVRRNTRPAPIRRAAACAEKVTGVPFQMRGSGLLSRQAGLEMPKPSNSLRLVPRRSEKGLNRLDLDLFQNSCQGFRAHIAPSHDCPCRFYDRFRLVLPPRHIFRNAAFHKATVPFGDVGHISSSSFSSDPILLPAPPEIKGGPRSGDRRKAMGDPVSEPSPFQPTVCAAAPPWGSTLTLCARSRWSLSVRRRWGLSVVLQRRNLPGQLRRGYLGELALLNA